MKTCFSCKWSIAELSYLYCTWKRVECVDVCEKYEREAGADEPSEIE